MNIVNRDKTPFGRRGGNQLIITEFSPVVIALIFSGASGVDSCQR